MVLIYQKTLSASRDESPPAGNVIALLTTDVNSITIFLPMILQNLFNFVQVVGNTVLSFSLLTCMT